MGLEGSQVVSRVLKGSQGVREQILSCLDQVVDGRLEVIYSLVTVICAGTKEHFPHLILSATIFTEV